jgi:peptidoglycan hydrolase-like protein with peptidoglycan-binding domain
MSPSSLRVILGGFLLLAGGIVVNAVLLQPAGGPPRLSKAEAERQAQKAAAERARRLAVDGSLEELRQRANPEPRTIATARVEPALDPGTPQRFARLRPDAATGFGKDLMPDAPDAEGSSDTIRAVQRELVLRGYGPIQVDGIPGLATRAAILAFEHDQKLPLTAEATETLLKSILLGVARPASDAGRVRTPQAEQVLRTVQQSLAAMNYQPGRVDGRLGEETDRAIREFEMDEGLAATGRPSAELVLRLAKKAGAGRLSQKR